MAADVSSTSRAFDLAPTKSSIGFEFPALCSFPPLYTCVHLAVYCRLMSRRRQPNEKTWASQSKLWTDLVLSYCRFHRVFRLELGDAGIAASDLWSNRALDRASSDACMALTPSGRVSAQLQREIVDLLVKAGSAAYDPPPTRSAPNPAACFVYWRRPDEWGEIMYADVVARGETNSIMTLFELQQGDATPAEAEYREMPTALLRTCLATLAKSGRAQVFRGTEGDGDGVKFV